MAETKRMLDLAEWLVEVKEIAPGHEALRDEVLRAFNKAESVNRLVVLRTPFGALVGYLRKPGHLPPEGFPALLPRDSHEFKAALAAAREAAAKPKGKLRDGN